MKSATSIAALVAALLHAQGARAEDSSIDDEGNIVVTGQVLYADAVNAVKTPTPIIDVPQSLSITTSEQIIEQGFDSIGDIVLYTPGVTQSQGEGHRDAVVFRGVRSTADFFIDGVRDDVQYYRSLYNLEQVEILRGPNALLFGRGGTGGILNRVTKKAVTNDSFGGFQGSVDTFGAFSGQVDTNIALGQNENVGLRVNAYYESLNNHRDFFDGDRFGINPSLRVAISPDTTFDLSYEYANNERFIDRGIPSLNGAPAEALADITFGDPELNFTTFEAHVVRAALSHKFSDSFKANVSASYGDYDKLYSNFFAVGFDPIANSVALDGYIDTTQRESFTLAANLVGEFETGGIGHTLVFGGEYIDTSNDNDRFNAFFDTSMDDVESFPVARPLALNGGIGINAAGDPTTNSFAVDLNDDTAADVAVFSAYIQDQIAITDWLDIVVGVRFDSFDITVDNVETFIDTGVSDILSRKDEEFSPRAGLIVKPQENISIYASYSESFLPRSGEQFADINPPDDALDPDTFQNLELGLKWDFAPSLSFTAAIFDIEQSSPQVADLDPGTLDVIDSNIQGIEAQIQGYLTDKWYASAGYSYLDGNQVEDDGSEIFRLRELPEHTFNFWSRYQFTEKFGLGAGFTFQDESFADNGNNVTLPSFIRFDAAAYYDVSENLRVQVNIENLFDEEYFPNAHTANNITVGAPLNARFTISGRF